MPESFEIAGKIIDVVSRRIFRGIVMVSKGRIAEIREDDNVPDRYILPGLIDAHIHIESSMLIPSEFARIAVTHGTVATVSDPHEIGNVLGIEGVRFMIENGKKVPFKFYFGAPACVPATTFETSGSAIGVKEVEELLMSKDIYGLCEMMNVPGVLFSDPVVMQKLALARKYKKPVDGHAPGLMGKEASDYIAAGITSDHECFTIEEAVGKIQHGMKILIREGSAAKNFDVLLPLIKEYPDMIMFCSDDKHPNDLVKGHINDLVKRALVKGFDPVTVIRCCTYNPSKHYHLNTGLLQIGDPADMIVVNNLNEFNVEETYIDGILVSQNGKTLINSFHEAALNYFNASFVRSEDIRIIPERGMIRVIQIIEGQLVTEELLVEGKVENNNIISNISEDILKIVVKNRYSDASPAIGFVKGFGLEQGAIGSSIAHDSHNIIAVGADDLSIAEAINMIITTKGGISCVNKDDRRILPLPFGGIMTGDNGFIVSSLYEQFDRMTKSMGCDLSSPYMTLSFMALLVIPSLKLSDKGLFDGINFRLTGLFRNES